ncbi:MAG: hypothetical protein J1F18_07465 [Lachnospiraceae bacterium]|nr:hypothetical protein [Lachnospiraceae bacterium]
MFFENISAFLIEYFSDIYHVIFWVLVAIALLIEAIREIYRRRNKINLWLRDHNVGRKY